MILQCSSTHSPFNCFHLYNENVFSYYCREIKLEEAAVLHYTYPKFSDLTSRRDRCGCKPTKEDVKRCFMLEFDRAVSNRQAVVLNHVNLDYNHNFN